MAKVQCAFVTLLMVGLGSIGLTAQQVARPARRSAAPPPVCRPLNVHAFNQVATRTTPPFPTSPQSFQITKDCWWYWEPTKVQRRAYHLDWMTFSFCNACAVPIEFQMGAISSRLLPSCSSEWTRSVTGNGGTESRNCDTAEVPAGQNYLWSMFDVRARADGSTGAFVRLDPEIVIVRRNSLPFALAELEIPAGDPLLVVGSVPGDWVEQLRAQGARIADAEPAAIVLMYSPDGNLADISALLASEAALAGLVTKAGVRWLLTPPGVKPGFDSSIQPDVSRMPIGLTSEWTATAVLVNPSQQP